MRYITVACAAVSHHLVFTLRDVVAGAADVQRYRDQGQPFRDACDRPYHQKAVQVRGHHGGEMYTTPRGRLAPQDHGLVRRDGVHIEAQWVV